MAFVLREREEQVAGQSPAQRAVAAGSGRLPRPACAAVPRQRRHRGGLDGDGRRGKVLRHHAALPRRRGTCSVRASTCATPSPWCTWPTDDAVACVVSVDSKSIQVHVTGPAQVRRSRGIDLAAPEYALHGHHQDLPQRATQCQRLSSQQVQCQLMCRCASVQALTPQLASAGWALRRQCG